MAQARIERGLLAAVLPPRTWPLLSFTFLGPLAIGLSLHALVQLERGMLFSGLLIGAVALALGSLPARRKSAGDPLRQTIDGRLGGDRRLFVGFLALGASALAGFALAPLRLALGGAGVLAGFGYLLTLGNSSRPPAGEGRRISAHLIPFCYALGPPGAIGIATLAMQPAHLGPWRDLVYLGLGRVAAVAALTFFVLVERELRRRRARTGGRIPDEHLPHRILIFLLALTGPLVPGGGTPYAVSWAVAWFVAAAYERRLRVA